MYERGNWLRSRTTGEVFKITRCDEVITYQNHERGGELPAGDIPTHFAKTNIMPSTVAGVASYSLERFQKICRMHNLPAIAQPTTVKADYVDRTIMWTILSGLCWIACAVRIFGD